MDSLNSTSDIHLSDNCGKRDIPSFIEPRPPLVSNPFLRPKPNRAVNLMSAFEESNESDESELVQVYLRLRPCKRPSPLYDVVSDTKLITHTDTTTAGHGRKTQHNVSKVYAFSNIFSADTSQKEIFEKVVKSNLNKLPDGQSYNLMTYGASGSGKTFTLMGTVTSPGLVPRSLEYLFKIIDAAQQPLYRPTDYGGVDKLTCYEQESELNLVKKFSQMSAPLRNKYRRMSVTLNKNLTTSNFDLSSRKRHYVWVSFIEIYNESLYDLLQTTNRCNAASKLRIREDPATGLVYAKGLTQAFVRSGEEAYDVMVGGKHNLQVAATGVHARSSRSHCIFTITLITETDTGIRTSYVRLCDLAGCERAGRTNNTGARMAESRAINTSLHVLQRCLHALRNKRHDAVVPYRESKLTRLLGAGLSGGRGEAVSMVVTLNPDVTFVQESKYVLQLAAVVGDIQLNQTCLPVESMMTTTFDDVTTCDSLESDSVAQENMRLRATVERLHFELQQQESENRRLSRLVEEKAALINECVEQAKAMLIKYYEGQMKVVQKRHQREVDELKEELEFYKRRVLNESSSHQDTQQNENSEVNKYDNEDMDEDETSVTNKSCDEDIDEDNRETLNEDDVQSSSEAEKSLSEDEDEKSGDEQNVSSTKKDNLVLLIESDSEDELNQSLEPRFKIKDVNEKRNSKNMSKQALLEDEEDPCYNDDDVQESSNLSNKNTHTIDRDIDNDSLDSANELSRDSIEMENEKNVSEMQYNNDKENTRNSSNKDETNVNAALHSSKESAIDKTPNDFEDDCAKEAENKESTEGYESCTEIELNAEIAQNFAQRKAYSVDVVPANEVDDTHEVFKKPDKRGTFVVKNKSEFKVFTKTATAKRKTDSLALFEQFEEDLDMQYKSKAETKIRPNSILDFAKLKITAANIFDKKSQAADNSSKTSKNIDSVKSITEIDLSKKTDDINIDKTVKNTPEKHEMPNKAKTYFDYPKDTPAKQFEMVTLNLNSEQCSEFFRDQEIKSKNDNLFKSDEHNPVGKLTYTKEDDFNGSKHTTKTSIDIFDEIAESPLKVNNKTKTQECIDKEKAFTTTDLTKDKANVTAEFDQLLTNMSINKEPEFESLVAIKDNIPKESGEKINEELIKKDAKSYKIMNDSNIFLKSINSSSSQKNDKTQENIYNITSAETTTSYCEQEFTRNIKSNLVSLNKQDSEANDTIIQDSKVIEKTEPRKPFNIKNKPDLITKSDTIIAVTTAELTKKEKEAAKINKKATEFEIPRVSKTISLDFEMLAENIDSKPSEFEQLAKTAKARVSEFDRIASEIDANTDVKSKHSKEGMSSTKESKAIVTTNKPSKNHEDTITIEKKDYKFKIPEICNTISLDLDMLAENIDTRPSEFEKLAKNISAKASEFERLAENIDDKVKVTENAVKVVDIPSKAAEKEIFAKPLSKKCLDIANKHEPKQLDKTHPTDFEKLVNACDSKHKTHDKPPNIETESLEFELLAQNLNSRPSEFENLAKNVNTRPSEFDKLAKNIDNKQSKSETLPKTVESSEFKKLAQSMDTSSSEFEKLAKNIDTRPSQFEKLVETESNTKKSEKPTTQTEGTKGQKLRYNLRHKTDAENDEIIFEVENVISDINFQKIISKTDFQNDPKYNLRHAKTDENEQPTTATKSKRNLRLRKQKTTEAEKVETQKSDKVESQKLKDIVNLRRDFADVMMDEKVPEKTIEKSPSPEIKSCEENVPVEACQSVPKSRRKLFTPRAELLEESTAEDGVTVSGERIKIPRPSYQKTRTRRRLNN